MSKTTKIIIAVVAIAVIGYYVVWPYIQKQKAAKETAAVK